MLVDAVGVGHHGEAHAIPLKVIRTLTLPLRRGDAHIGQTDLLHGLHGAHDALSAAIQRVVVDEGHQIDAGLLRRRTEGIRRVEGEEGLGILQLLACQRGLHVADDVVRLPEHGDDLFIHGCKIIGAVRTLCRLQNRRLAHDVADDGDLHT